MERANACRCNPRVAAADAEYGERGSLCFPRSSVRVSAWRAFTRKARCYCAQVIEQCDYVKSRTEAWLHGHTWDSAQHRRVSRSCFLIAQALVCLACGDCFQFC